MINHVWSVLCQRSLVDEKTKNVSLIDIFERIDVNAPSDKKNLPKIIEIPVNYEVATLWSYDKLNKDKIIYTKLVFKTPNNKKFEIFKKKLVLPKDKIRMRDIMKIQGLVLNGSGKYFFNLYSKQEKNNKYTLKATLPLEVNIQTNTSIKKS